jgi:hypothetical protein
MNWIKIHLELNMKQTSKALISILFVYFFVSFFFISVGIEVSAVDTEPQIYKETQLTLINHDGVFRLNTYHRFNSGINAYVVSDSVATNSISNVHGKINGLELNQTDLCVFSENSSL